VERNSVSFNFCEFNDSFLIEWLAIKGKEQRQFWPWKAEHDDIMRHAYLYYYTSSFAQPHFRDALAKIPNVFQVRKVVTRLTID